MPDKPGRALYAEWNDGGKEPQNPPNPAYPKGVDIDASKGAKPSCKIELPYPAKRCGHYVIRCRLCGYSGAVTTAGRVDDPRSFTAPCKVK